MELINKFYDANYNSTILLYWISNKYYKVYSDLYYSRISCAGVTHNYVNGKVIMLKHDINEKPIPVHVMNQLNDYNNFIEIDADNFNINKYIHLDVIVRNRLNKSTKALAL